MRIVAWFDSLRLDAVFGWRQLNRRKVTSAAAILSLALAIGSCTSAFRIVNALFLRPLPIANPKRLYELTRAGSTAGWPYTAFRQMRPTVKDAAELIPVSNAQIDVTYHGDAEAEKANVSFVAGWMFPDFGLRPALGRLLSASDDLKSGTSPIAVLSYDYWTRRFARDPDVIGSTVRMGPDWRIGQTAKAFDIVGVAPEGFTGTEPGTVTAIFVPATMQAMVDVPYAGVYQMFVLLKPGVAIDPVRDRLLAALRSAEPSKAPRALVTEPAAAGSSGLRNDYAYALAALGVLVGLVLLIACVNVANLMAAQAAARATEMALRIAIGAGRRRLVQLVLVESTMLALFAAAFGTLFASWSAPLVVARINPPDNPARLFLSADWRVVTFGLGLTFGVILLFGLAPALRASRLQPFGALRSGATRLRWMHSLISVQAAFCFLVLFVAGLFVATFHHLSDLPTGISASGLLNLNIIPLRRNEPVALWEETTEHLRKVPGVESAAFADWPVLDGYSYKTTGVSINGLPPNDVTAWTMNISPGWTGVMGIPLLAGRDLRLTDPPGDVIVNEEFAKAFFGGENPIGKTFQGTAGAMDGRQFEIVGLVRNARYRYLRQAMLPVIYTAFHDGKGLVQGGTFVVRTRAKDPLALASLLRAEIRRDQPTFRVTSIQTQHALINVQTIRERLLALLALFFATVALLLAALGLYGVLDYSVFQRRREIGIRIAVGAQASDLARRVTFDVFSMVLLGAIAGLSLGMVSARYIGSLLYEVKPTGISALALPSLALIAAAILAALPPVIRAIRIDPVEVLRSE
ncbi:MAG TPA: ADOP family duplicated permease [Bryobacteraceae bacterium]|nr:ADOP family duplicated permease [Bryobacteraceae bacterium]